MDEGGAPALRNFFFIAISAIAAFGAFVFTVVEFRTLMERVAPSPWRPLLVLTLVLASFAFGFWRLVTKNRFGRVLKTSGYFCAAGFVAGIYVGYLQFITRSSLGSLIEGTVLCLFLAAAVFGGAFTILTFGEAVSFSSVVVAFYNWLLGAGFDPAVVINALFHWDDSRDWRDVLKVLGTFAAANIFNRVVK